MEPNFILPVDLVGYWLFEHDDDDSPGLLIIDNSGRAVQFQTLKRRSRKDEVMRLWFTIENSTTMRFRGTPTAEGWLREVQRTDTGFSISSGDYVFPMRLVDKSELPGWIEEDYQTASDHMAARENA